MTTTNNTADFDTALATYLATLNATAAPGATFTAEGNRVYVRIVRNNTGRSAHAFVERATGLVFKPASWKGPVKNFPRGSVYETANVTGRYGL